MYVHELGFEILSEKVVHIYLLVNVNRNYFDFLYKYTQAVWWKEKHSVHNINILQFMYIEKLKKKGKECKK